MEIWIFAGTSILWLLVVFFAIRMARTTGTARGISMWFTLLLLEDPNMDTLPYEYRAYSGNKKVSCRLTLVRRTPDGRIVLNMWLNPKYQKFVLRELRKFKFMLVHRRGAENFELHIPVR